MHRVLCEIISHNLSHTQILLLLVAVRERARAILLYIGIRASPAFTVPTMRRISHGLCAIATIALVALGGSASPLTVTDMMQRTIYQVH